MLTEIRDRSSGWFAWIIAALIIIPMAFWGVQEYASTEAQLTIVEVGDQKISQAAFQQQLSNAQAQAAANNPSLANSDIFNSDFYKNQVLDGMVDRALAESIAVEQNYRVGDEQLAVLIKESPQFQTDGEFDKEAYERYAVSQGYSKNQFEQNSRARARISQVASGYSESALVLPDEVRELLEIQIEERSLDLITISQADFVAGVVVSEEDVSTYYEDNKASYMNPDRISVSYVELSRDQLASQITVDDAALKEIYDNNIDSYISPESRATRHILLSTTSGEDDGAQLAKANELLLELNGGADFSALAKEHSQDPGSAVNGGSLGDVERGVMVPEFETATYALEEGAISDPVKTQFGYHIIKLDKINGGEPQSFEEVKFDLQQEEMDRLAEEQMLDKVEQLRNMVFENPNSLDEVAADLELTMLNSTLFSRDKGQGIASNDLIRATAFSEQVAVDGLNSEPVELSDGVYIAMRKLNFVDAAPRELTEVSAQIKTKLTNERASAAAKLAGDSILARAASDWAELAGDESVEVASHTISMIKNESQLAQDIVRRVLKMQLLNEATKIDSFTGSNGDFNIVRLHQIAPGNLAAVSEQVKESTRRLIAKRNGESLFQSYLKGLAQPLKAGINQDLL